MQTPTPQDPTANPRSIDESVAATMWCPMATAMLVRNVSGSNVATVANRNSDATPVQGCTCIGTQCMGWINDPNTGPTSGYCGMAVA